MRTSSIALVAAAVAILSIHPGRAAESDAEPGTLPDHIDPLATCDVADDTVLVGNGIDRDDLTFVLRKSSGDAAKDCAPAFRSETDRFLARRFSCYGDGAAIVITDASPDEVGMRFILRKAGDDAEANCDPVSKSGDVVLNDKREEAATFVDLRVGRLFYETSTGPQGGLTLYDIAARKNLVKVEEGVVDSFTDTEFGYWERVREAKKSDCPADFDRLTEGTGAAGLYTLKTFDFASKKTRSGAERCLTEQ